MKAKPWWDRKAYMRAYMKAYRQRLEVKKRAKAYMKAYLQRPDVKERTRIYERARYRGKHTIPDAMLSPRVKRLLALAEGWT